MGFYDTRLKKISYLKPVVSDNETFLGSPVHKDTVNKFHAVEREVVGTINLYKREVSNSYHNGTMTMYNSTIYYYAEKGNDFKNIWITGFGNKKDDLVSLKSFVADEPALAQIIDSDDFNKNEKNMLKVINDYNLKKFVKPTQTDYKSLGTVSFYTSISPKLKETIVLKVNDSIDYRMPNTYYPLPIKIPMEVPSKICVISESGSYCQLIQPIQFTSEFYEITNPLTEKSLRIKPSTAHEAENYLMRARSK